MDSCLCHMVDSCVIVQYYHIATTCVLSGVIRPSGSRFVYSVFSALGSVFTQCFLALGKYALVRDEATFHD